LIKEYTFSGALSTSRSCILCMERGPRYVAMLTCRIRQTSDTAMMGAWTVRIRIPHACMAIISDSVENFSRTMRTLKISAMGRTKIASGTRARSRTSISSMDMTCPMRIHWTMNITPYRTRAAPRKTFMR
jgi:hypothetical protein